MRLVSLPECARLLERSPKSLRKLLARNKGPEAHVLKLKRGSRYVFDLEALERYRDGREITGTY